MIVRRLLYVLSILLIALGFLKSGQASAASDDAPLITRAGNGLYAVLPTGESRLLDEVPPELDQVFKKNWAGAAIRIDSLSPDNTYLAYSTGLSEILDPAYTDVQMLMAQRAPNEVYLVNIATGQRTTVTNQSDTFADAVAARIVQNYNHLTWSMDGSRLYYAADSRSLDDRPDKRTLHYYDLATSTRHDVANLLPPPLTVDNGLLGLYPAPTGIAAVTALDYNGTMRFTLYGADNIVINEFELQLMGMQDVNAWMLNHNPIHEGDNFMFGFFTVDHNGPQPNVLDLPSGKSQAANPSRYVTSVSRIVPSSSLRIVLNVTALDIPAWVVADTQGNRLLTLDTALFITDTAVTPDGQTVAYLGERHKADEPRDIFIFDGSQSRQLGFAADEILWGAVDYSFAPLN